MTTAPTTLHRPRGTPWRRLLRATLAVLCALPWAPAARADVSVPGDTVVVRTPTGGDKALEPSRIMAVGMLTAGNGVYTVYVADEGMLACGAWTARTGVLHEAGPGLNVLYGNGVPSTSDTTLNSYSSGVMYRTGSRTECTRLCQEDAPTVESLVRSGVTTGFRLTWLIQDAPGVVVEFVQEVEVEGPVDGSETVDDTVIRETHVVRNVGSSPFEYGLRKHWDWQIGPDDGPWFGDCETPDAACDRSMNMFENGSGSGPYPRNYVINHDPDSALCPAGTAPLDGNGCVGNPLYIVAGTVDGPSALVPPPDPPELLQFNSWTRLVRTCWQASLDDAAPCGTLGSPGDDTAVAYFYGLTSASAHELQPGQERAYTEYVVAGDLECPDVFDPPATECLAGGPHLLECAGASAAVALDGEAPGASSISWSSDCPSASFDDASAEDPVLTLSPAGCALECEATLVATFSDGSQASCSASISVVDTDAPSMSCPGDLQVTCSGGGVAATHPAVAAWLGSASATDACAGAVDVANDLPSFVGLDACPTVRTVTFTAGDGCGHVATCKRILTIVDADAPELECPPDALWECGGAIPDAKGWFDATATDACDGTWTVAASLVGTSTPCPDGTVQTWLVETEDSCGNPASCTRTWTVRDTTPPQLLGVPADDVVSCDGIPAAASPTAVDACDPEPDVDFSETVLAGSCAGSHVLVRTWTATDRCGNAASLSQHVTVQDNDGPAFSMLPASAEVDCSQALLAPQVTASDPCDPEVEVDFTEETAPGSCADESVVTRTWTASDDCGNVTTHVQVVTMVDRTPPSLAAAPADALADCADVPPIESLAATDDCDPAPEVEASEVRQDGDCPDEYQLVRTWTATDRCGNSSQVGQVLTVRDLTAPVLAAAPASAVVDCDDVPPLSQLSASDDCDPEPDVEASELRQDGDCPDEYELVRTWTATDRCGNSSQVSQVLTVRDVTPPVLPPAPASATVDCHDVPPLSELSASDACDPEPDVEASEVRADGDCPDEYELVRTWTATDRCGNSSQVSQVLTVRDVTPPVLPPAPASATVDCHAVPPLSELSASDACDPEPDVESSEVRADGDCPDEYEVVRTWTATDRCGNSSQVSQVLVVRDVTPPVLEAAPPNALVGCDAVPPLGSLAATDDCDPEPDVEATEVLQQGVCADEYELVRTWTAVDRCGNSAQRVQVLTVRDLAPPQLSGDPEDAVVGCGNVPPAAALTATDDCDPAPQVAFTEERLDGDCPDEYELVRTWVATDRCGASSEVTQVVTVRDMAAPAIAAPPNEIAECDAVPPVSPPLVVDDCDPIPALSFVETQVAGPCPHSYQLLRSWTARDRCNNTASAVQVVTVQDTTPPILEVPEPLVLECTGSGGVSASDPRVVEWLARAAAWDNCSGTLPVSHDVPAFLAVGCPDRTLATVTFGASDECGHSVSATSTIEVVDTTPPTLLGHDLPGCLWAPNHRYACVVEVASRVQAADDCSNVRVFVESCSSDQPDDAHQDPRDVGNGDGHHEADCVVAPDGSAICVRSERQGTDRTGRDYALTVALVDDCGNRTELPWTLHVPHDQRDHSCPKVPNSALLKPHSPFPWE